MNTLRRHLITVPAAAVALAPFATASLRPAHAQADIPGEGKTWRRLARPVRVEPPAGKVDVVEFFWYGCPHCYRFEPVLRRWIANLPADVAFRRVHVPFSERKHQQLYYTLLAMGEADRLAPDIFRALHEEGKRLVGDDEIADWVAAHGVDRKAFTEQFGSFGVRTAMTRGTREMTDWGVDGVPMIGAAGKYLTAPSLAGSNQAALDLIDQFVASERVAMRRG